MSSANFATLSDRGTVSVTGPDAEKLLQGLLTNDVARLEMKPPADASGSAAAAYAGLLSPQGKILFDFFAVRVPDGFLLDVARDKAADLAKRLTMYKLRAAVEIRDASDGFAILALWGPDARSCAAKAGTITYQDPRHADLGLRLLAESRPGVDVAPVKNATNVEARAYHAHRIGLGIPEGGKDFAFGDAFPHEAMMDLLHGASFTKGCYVGQEIVSRMQHRGTARKRIIPVNGAAPLSTGAEVMAGDIAIGTVGSVAAAKGLALLRLDRATELTRAGATLTAGGVAIEMDIPSWARDALDPVMKV